MRSGSLAAPVLLHLAANCTAPLTSALARQGLPHQRPNRVFQRADAEQEHRYGHLAG
jgi:hypothetical protein